MFGCLTSSRLSHCHKVNLFFKVPMSILSVSMCTLYLLLCLMRIYDTPLKLKNKALSLPYPTELALFGMTMRHGVAYPETFGVVAYCESTLFLPLYNMEIHLLFILAYCWILKCSRNSGYGLCFICRSL